jgi:hypothetical protein
MLNQQERVSAVLVVNLFLIRLSAFLLYYTKEGGGELEKFSIVLTSPEFNAYRGKLQLEILR